jgi:hypothetical protein
MGPYCRRNLRLLTGRGSVESATGRSRYERRGTRFCAIHINRVHPVSKHVVWGQGAVPAGDGLLFWSEAY